MQILVFPKLAILTVGVVSIAHGRVNERLDAQLGASILDVWLSEGDG